MPARECSAGAHAFWWSGMWTACRGCGLSCRCITNSRATACGGKTRPAGWAIFPRFSERRAPKLFHVSSSNGNGGDGSNIAQLQTLGGAELSAAFEGYASALTVQAEGLNDMVIAGPGSSLHDSSDASEPYQWVPGDDYANGSVSYIWSGGQAAGLAAWVFDFLAAYDADNSLRAVLTLYDGS